MKLPIRAIKEDPAIQLRGGLDMERIEGMREFITNGGVLPPVTVVGDDNLLADGHHRLYRAMIAKDAEIEANRAAGGRAEAIALSIMLNDTAASQPLTRVQRNAGIKMLLEAGWTQNQIAKATGVHATTVDDIAIAMKMRGAAIIPNIRNGGGVKSKPVAALPAAVHTKLNDTTLTRIAALPVEEQPAFAAAVASSTDHAGRVMSEPRVREAIKDLKANPGMTPAQAVARHAPSTMPSTPPATMQDVAKQVRRRLEDLVNVTITVDGTPRDFWEVLDILNANRDLLLDDGRGIAALLSDLAVKADHHATKFNTPTSAMKRVSA